MQQKPRVRFAPSPTGPLHIGGVRTALYNYLFARQRGGSFILRIEDTDTTRFVPGTEEYIQETFDWLGLPFDESPRQGGKYGPYKQSQRKEIYKEHVHQLLEKGAAYIAFDTPEELEAQRAAKENFQYDASTRMQMRNSLTMKKEETDSLIQGKTQYVVRIKIEPGRDIVVHDLIRGDVVINSSVLDDKVIYKSADELPTYHLANVVDDHLMEITHVIRGEEWLPSMPLHVMLYRAFGWTDTMPQFAHLPLILKPSGNGKLSKRDGDKLGFPVFPINWNNPETNEIFSGYREAGYFNDAFVNILALLGWNDGTDKEIYSMDELIEAFSLERVGKSGSRFDPEKAKWFNHQYMLQKSDEEIAEAFISGNETKVPSFTDMTEEDWDRVVKIISLVKDRVEFVKDIWSQAWFFFEAPVTYDEAVIKKRWSPDMPAILEGISELIISSVPANEGTAEAYESLIKGHITTNNLNMGNVMNVLRLCLVGAPMGPGIYDIMELLGPDEVIARIGKLVKTVG